MTRLPEIDEDIEKYIKEIFPNGCNESDAQYLRKVQMDRKEMQSFGVTLFNVTNKSEHNGKKI